MSFFSKLLENRGLPKHDSRPLWKYFLTDQEFQELKADLKSSHTFKLISPKDATLFYSEWWKRNYNGNKPSKEDVFNALNISNKEITAESFYVLAKQGAQLLGIRWIKRQNTLFFRTLLLQGGLPINHITSNAGYYRTFLIKLLSIQPNSVEEIILHPLLNTLLPHSSRNEIIYENCLDIINSFINNDYNIYKEIFEGNATLKGIGIELENERSKLIKRKNEGEKPKVFWVLEQNDNRTRIILKIGFSELYHKESLQNLLNLEELPNERSYQIYMNDKLICTFKKLLSENYKTYWESSGNLTWNIEKVLPQFYTITSNSHRNEIPLLISVMPSIEEPTLWISSGVKEWRLVKGNSFNSDEAYVLYSKGISENIEDSIETNELIISGHTFKFTKFKGEFELLINDLSTKFSTKTESFEWYIIDDKPKWMRSSNIPVISGSYIRITDESNKPLLDIYFKSLQQPNWQPYNRNVNLPTGLIDLKINHNDITVYDKIYNINKLNLEIAEQNINKVILRWSNIEFLKVELTKSEKYKVDLINTDYHLELEEPYNFIPTYIEARLKKNSERSLYFTLGTPFNGIGLLDKEEKLMEDNVILALPDLYGYRIFNSGETTIKMYNTLKEDVIIGKKIAVALQPLISFKEDLERLFYLADAMDHKNMVLVEISNDKKKNFKFYVKGFTHSIDKVSTQLERKVLLTGPGNIQLFAVPLNLKPDKIKELILYNDDQDVHHLSANTTPGQFIIISTYNEGKQLQPRFINTDPDYIPIDKNERIKKYGEDLLHTEFNSDAWNELNIYHNICLQYKIPFSTFDQLRAVGLSSELAARAFFFFGINQYEPDEYIQRQVPILEQDLGFSFHWISKSDWEKAISSVANLSGLNFPILLELMHKYFQEIKMTELFGFITGRVIDNNQRIDNSMILNERALLGERVLEELPKTHLPNISETNYGINFETHYRVKLLLYAPIAVAESIKNMGNSSIWSTDNNLRRNIQYAQYIAPNLYIKVLNHALLIKNP